MSERMRKGLVFGSLVLAILYAAYNFSGSDGPKPVDQPQTIEPLAANVAQTAAPSLKDRDVKMLEEAPWGQDPFAAPKRKTVAAGPRLSWNLKGIVYNPSRPLAYINGVRVGVGDMVNSAKVIAIERTKVTLNYQGDQFDVFVHKG